VGESKDLVRSECRPEKALATGWRKVNRRTAEITYTLAYVVATTRTGRFPDPSRRGTRVWDPQVTGFGREMRFVDGSAESSSIERRENSKKKDDPFRFGLGPFGMDRPLVSGEGGS
jgi:hypothetical protein